MYCSFLAEDSRYVAKLGQQPARLSGVTQGSALFCTRPAAPLHAERLVDALEGVADGRGRATECRSDFLVRRALRVQEKDGDDGRIVALAFLRSAKLAKEVGQRRGHDLPVHHGRGDNAARAAVLDVVQVVQGRLAQDRQQVGGFDAERPVAGTGGLLQRALPVGAEPALQEETPSQGAIVGGGQQPECNPAHQDRMPPQREVGVVAAIQPA